MNPAPTAPTFSAPVLVLLRKNAGLTRPQLARAADLNPSQLWRIETGKAVPYDSTVGRLARALGVPVSLLLTPPSA